ncbi:hypothetical protein GC173_05145 [bacterium]|nr:hypothetical protein [bacterium]
MAASSFDRFRVRVFRQRLWRRWTQPRIFRRMVSLGSRGIMAPEIANFLATNGPRPSQANVDRLASFADRLVIEFRPMGGSAKPPIELRAPDEIARFLHCIRLAPEQSGGHLLTFAFARVQFHGFGRVLDTVEILCGGGTLRWDAWHGDGHMADDSLPGWLAEHGHPELLEEREDTRRRREEDRKRIDAWDACIPEPLRRAAEWTNKHPEEGLDHLKQTAAKAFPDPKARATALLRWVGGVEPIYSGYTSTEAYPLDLLRDLQPEAVIAALRSASPDGPEWKGAVRHYLSWEMQNKREREIRAVPPDLAKQLRSAALQCTDDYYHERAAKYWPG